MADAGASKLILCIAVYLGSSIDQNGWCDTDICRSELARSCMRALDRGIPRTSISLPTELRLYNIYVLPVLLYGADTWSVTVTARRCRDAFDRCCLQHILRIPYTAHVSNLTIRKRAKQSRVASAILDRRLKLAIFAEATHRMITHLRSRPSSTVYQRIGDFRVVVLASLGCEQSRETSRPRTSDPFQPGISHSRENSYTAGEASHSMLTTAVALTE